jgi:hypothetical protein
MMKTFNEAQMGDPWRWALNVLDKYKIKPKELSDHLGCPQSTIRSLMNQTNDNPKYGTLLQIIEVCIALENGLNFVSVGPVEVEEPQLTGTIEDWL